MVNSIGKTGKTILAVDDTPMNLSLLEGLLLPSGYLVETAESGQVALDLIDSKIPDLILLDVMMPEMDGFEVCRRVRENKILPYIPIIFITASELDLRDIIRGLDQGGDDYIRKPFNIEELLSRIRSALRAKTLYDEMARIKAELAQYVSVSTQRLVEDESPEKAPHSNRTSEATILFSDMRGFTQLSQYEEPQKVFDMLNLNLGKQIEVIDEFGGIIDKLSGDEVMAVFEGPEMAEKALSCAIAIIDSLSEIRIQKGDKWASVGIGINTGSVFWGSLGTIAFKDFTVIGNTVNVAARLCGLAKQFQILFSETTLESIQQEQFRFESIGEQMFKGFTVPTEVYAIMQ